MYDFLVTITSQFTGEIHEFKHNDINLTLGLREVNAQIEAQFMHLMDLEGSDIKIKYRRLK